MTVTHNNRVRAPLTIGLGIVLVIALLVRPAAAGEDGTLIVELRDPEGAPLGGGCFLAEGIEAKPPVCDNDGRDGAPDVGVVQFADLLPGEWLVLQTSAPAGYAIGADTAQTVSVGPDETVSVTFVNAPSEPGIVSSFPDVDAEVQPPDQPHQPIATAPPARIDLTPTCNGRKATIVAAANASGVPTKIVGTNGDDVIVGTAGPDLIAGLGGHDTICSLGGDDIVGGGDGDDVIAGGGGIDHLDGGPGKRDACDGGAGTDVAVGCETIAAIP
jgi:hypothetical protein